ncbi:cytochrome c [Longimicrobium terrae]|uniref:Mono/diheme cytochrome c family protein n=1 Tax=Longimicrobium terrae TaxID=1639882 RepID=A0A841H3S3_9BACT|nr:cytochrome c [Longimicrobium terrae]MBB4638376.1 mono/diheme cytochrome c family protein [Longimicrobium terrae]MBB6072556.1 mono/diheme cytochrome c family protein [Longimicrobium terrae]NNC28665.1 c-type cytochrome [Longimicrobium terrae]
MKTILRWTARIGAGVLALLLVALAGVYGLTEARMRRQYQVPSAAPALAATAARVAEGKRLAVTRGCTDCHGADMSGHEVINQFPIGRVSGSNLTRGRGGVAARYTDADFVRAIRHGVNADGRGLLLMPSDEFNSMSDDEVGSIVAYLRTLPPVNHETRPNAVWPLGRALYAGGVIPLVAAERIDHAAPRAPAPPPGVTAAYGRHLAAGCAGCHGKSFAGGAVPGGPPEWAPASNLTPHATDGLGGWTEADFIRALRTGRRPDGTELREPMPWKAFSQMTDVEARALWVYLQTLPALPDGSPRDP